MHSVDGIEDACSNDFGAISKVEWEDAFVADGRRTGVVSYVKSDFEEVDRVISSFGSDPDSVSVLDVNADTDEDSGCTLPPLFGSSDGSTGLIIEELFFTKFSVSFFTFLVFLSLCTLFPFVFLEELSLFCFSSAWLEEESS